MLEFNVYSCFLLSLHHLIDNFFCVAGYLGQSICLIRRERNISCLGGRVSGLCIGLSLVHRPPHSEDEEALSEDDYGESEDQQQRYC